MLQIVIRDSASTMPRLRCIVLGMLMAGLQLVLPKAVQARLSQAMLSTGKCVSQKIASVSDSLGRGVGCFKRGGGDPTCLANASARLATKFADLEVKYPPATRQACLTFGDAGALDTIIMNYVASIPPTTGMGPGICDYRKIRCMGDYGKAMLRCYEKDTGKSGIVRPTCLSQAGFKLANGWAGCLDNAAKTGDCTYPGSQAVTLKGAADQFIAETVAALASDPRYVDNGDGTVTDTQTGLMWEQKTSDDGIANYADPHDVDNTYTWSTGGPAWNPDGTAFTDFLVKLNTPPCFAGHCDWRLPSEDGRNAPYTGAKELENIVKCTGSTCGIDMIFGPNVFVYWSATSEATRPEYVWSVYFNIRRGVRSMYKDNSGYVRAVRTGP